MKSQKMNFTDLEITIDAQSLRRYLKGYKIILIRPMGGVEFWVEVNRADFLRLAIAYGGPWELDLRDNLAYIERVYS